MTDIVGFVLLVGVVLVMLWLFCWLWDVLVAFVLFVLVESILLGVGLCWLRQLCCLYCESCTCSIMGVLLVVGVFLVVGLCCL